MASERSTVFDACHPAAPAVLFAGVLVLTMLAVQPVLVVISLAGALCFSLVARGAKATVRGFTWQLPLLALVCLANPLFSASGSTLLFKLGPRSVYLESLAYGATMGALLVAVVLWIEGASTVLTQDRLLALAPRRARVVSMLAAMTSQLMPQLLRRSRDVRAAIAATTAAGRRLGAHQALMKTSTLLLNWSLEESVGRADSMRARGWESGAPRTCYHPERLRRRDVAAVVGILLLLVACAICAWTVCVDWRFYPRMGEVGALLLYAPFAVLAFLPAALEWAGRVQLADGRAVCKGVQR